MSSWLVVRRKRRVRSLLSYLVGPASPSAATLSVSAFSCITRGSSSWPSRSISWISAFSATWKTLPTASAACKGLGRKVNSHSTSHGDVSPPEPRDCFVTGSATQSPSMPSCTRPTSHTRKLRFSCAIESVSLCAVSCATTCPALSLPPHVGSKAHCSPVSATTMSCATKSSKFSGGTSISTDSPSASMTSSASAQTSKQTASLHRYATNFSSSAGRLSEKVLSVNLCTAFLPAEIEVLRR
mmetsp:Transcript_20229/g.51518  ORF Transcript_20229/g.51518 Transcript_20229/m.51518 type:complete len:241 (+) Transcript_20229:824-1546(+)